MILSNASEKSREECHIDLFIHSWRETAERMISATLADPESAICIIRAAGLKPSHIPFPDLGLLLEIVVASIDKNTEPSIKLIIAVGEELGESVELRNIEHLQCLESSAAGLKNYVAFLIDYQRRVALAETLRRTYGKLLDRFAPSTETVGELKTAIENWQTGSTTEPPKLTRPPIIVVRPRRHSTTIKKRSCRIGGAA